VALSADGNRIVSGGSDGTVMVWDAGEGQVVRTLTDIDKIRSVGFSGDGKRIVASSDKGRIRSWDAIKGQEVTPCTDPPPPDGQREAVSPDGKLRIWADGTNVHAARID
jgi:WD40 repeat protein